MKNKIELFDDYAKCYITDKCFFLLDLDDVEMAGQYHWILNKDGYACAWINKCPAHFTAMLWENLKGKQSTILIITNLIIAETISESVQREKIIKTAVIQTIRLG